MLRNFVKVISILVLVSGCASSAPLTGTVSNSTKPSLGEITTAEIGEPLFRSTTARTTRGVEFSSGLQYNATAGHVWELKPPWAETTQGKFCGSALHVQGFLGGPPPMGGPQVQRMCLEEDWFLDNAPASKFGTVTLNTPDFFQRELIYTGQQSGNINILYREFAGDTIRPAFSQDLTFNIATDPNFGAQGARIKVYEATNTEIRYEVIRPFSE
ncbi:MAG: hypothetical protein WA989_07930 [Henriciella sp.]|uniref:hypothetical protein n=1 Tax=Henriciella sp. TaxID=1968823 RepID=UPI003C748C95